MDFLEFVDQKDPLVKYDWMESGNFEFILVTPDNITECIDACINGVNGRFALDLETTGIDNRVDDATGTTKDKIVGVCLSGDGKRGWYIPLRHRNTKESPTAAEHNIPWSLFDREFRRLMDAVDAGNAVAIFHNGKFDQEFLEFHGGEPYGKWDGVKRWEDTLILAYLRNSRARRKGLKAMSEASTEADNTNVCGGPGLGMKMFELEDLFPEDHPKSQYDYSLLDPSEEGPLIYGCSDAICTYLLCDLLLPVVLTPEHGFSQRQIYNIEKACIICCRWMERNRIPTDPAKVMDLIKLGQQEWFNSIMEVYRAGSKILGRDVMPGYYKVLKNNKPGVDGGGFVPNDPTNLLPEQILRAKTFESRYFPNPIGRADTRGGNWPLIYDVNAPKQLGQMFEEMEVPGLVYTEKSGQVKTAKDVLNKVIQDAEKRFPFMGLIKRFRETNKALGSYLFPMLEDVDPNDFTMRINFNSLKTDTGRFSTPATEKELTSQKKKHRIPGWPEINLQSMPSTYNPKRPVCMNRLRECVAARPGYKLVAIDFAGEELRLVTNLSREPKWLEEFFRCSTCGRTFPRGDGRVTPMAPPARCPNCGGDKIGDLHTLTALSIYGEDATRKSDWKHLRGNAKGVNFALCYGGGGGAVVRACNVDKNEGWRIKNQFDGTYTGLKHWWAGQHKFANDHGFVRTAFGRIYPVPDIWSADGGFRSKAERNSVNGPIQGSGADIIKIAMALVYKHCKKRGWLTTCRLIGSMHDELVFEIHDDIIEQAINEIVLIMTSNKFVSTKRWPVPLTVDVEIGPNWTVSWDLNEMRNKEIRFEGDKKVNEPYEPLLKEWKGSPADFKDAVAAYPGKFQSWTAMPHCYPISLRPFFKNLNGPGEPDPDAPPVTPSEPPVVASPHVDQGTPTEPQEDAPVTVLDEVPVVVEETEGAPVTLTPPMDDGSGVFQFTLHARMSTITCVKLAEVIHACQNRGTRKLQLLLPDGTVLSGWSDGDVYVNNQQFYWWAQQAGL